MTGGTFRAAHAVYLEPVLVAHLLLTHLAVPAQSLQPLGFDAVAHRLGCHESCFRHSLSTQNSITRTAAVQTLSDANGMADAGSSDPDRGSVSYLVAPASPGARAIATSIVSHY